ncbi:MAG: Hsp20/alpha crystallin family protein [Candidatus Peregrinibacteria bacterium]
MTNSPFHGIFSTAFGQGSSSVADEAEEAAFAAAEPQQSSTGKTTDARQNGHITVDIFEQDAYYIIRAPIAGVKLSDLDIEVDGKSLTIRGNRKPSEDIPEDQYYLKECFWGEFSRSITLPCTIDPKRVKATFSKDCVLKVLIPKEERVKIIRINEG